jgi:hypothetical protein
MGALRSSGPVIYEMHNHFHGAILDGEELLRRLRGVGETQARYAGGRGPLESVA